MSEPKQEGSGALTFDTVHAYAIKHGGNPFTAAQCASALLGVAKPITKAVTFVRAQLNEMVDVTEELRKEKNGKTVVFSLAKQKQPDNGKDIDAILKQSQAQVQAMKKASVVKPKTKATASRKTNGDLRPRHEYVEGNTLGPKGVAIPYPHNRSYWHAGGLFTFKMLLTVKGKKRTMPNGERFEDTYFQDQRTGAFISGSRMKTDKKDLTLRWSWKYVSSNNHKPRYKP